MPCELIDQLKKLQKSAPESIDNANSLDAFKAYLHVENEVERELRTLLRRVNAKQSKCLVLVCGSAGEGKSHLVAHLKFTDPEHLLDGYILYNDATESDMPTQSSLERMAEKLESFSDASYEIPDGVKMIMAVNLGTLNNFIESEQGKNFSKLKKYITENGILSGYTRENGYQKESVFQHVSFSDYQLFTLTKDGVNTVFLEELLGKVFEQNADNPFYQAFVSCGSCSYCKRCPVRHNYEFLSNPVYQKNVIDRIVEIVMKEKAIVSTRNVLDLLYALIVHPKFNPAAFFPVNDIEFLQNYILYSTPMLLDECGDHELLRAMQKYDVLKKRSEKMDADAAQFHSLENIEEIFLRAAGDTPYAGIHEITNISVFGASKADLKTITYRFISRLRYMKGDLPAEAAQDHRYHQFISNLYYQNSGQIQELEELYYEVECAVMGWNGLFGSEKICIDSANEHYWVLENLKLQLLPPEGVCSGQVEIMRFAPVLNVRLAKDGGNESETAEIGLDYALFEMICSIQEGYRPTARDKNHHTDFVSFVNQLIEFGSKTSRVFLVSKETPAAPSLSFEKTGFKYKFGVI